MYKYTSLDMVVYENKGGLVSCYRGVGGHVFYFYFFLQKKQARLSSPLSRAMTRAPRDYPRGGRAHMRDAAPECRVRAACGGGVIARDRREGNNVAL